MFRVCPIAVGVVLTQLAAPTLGATPDDLLKEKGLKRAGAIYVLSEESEVARRSAEARTLYKAMTAAVQRERALAQGSKDNKTLVRELTAQRIALNQQLAQVTTVEENNRLVAVINELTDRINLLEEGQADPKATTEVQAVVAQKRGAYVEALIALRGVLNEASEKYKALAEDTQVTEALAALNKGSKTKLTLGPTPTFRANVKALEKAEAAILTESVDMKADNGVFAVDVTINGKVTRPFIFDTGAALVTLPSALAAEAGLKPGPNDPTIHLQLADGSVIEGKQMQLRALRVGKFVVEDVACAILPPTKADVEPLLGGSFLQNFTYKMHPDTGKLVLSKVDLGTSASTGRTTGKASKKKSKED